LGSGNKAGAWLSTASVAHRKRRHRTPSWRSTLNCSEPLGSLPKPASSRMLAEPPSVAALVPFGLGLGFGFGLGLGLGLGLGFGLGLGLGLGLGWRP
jgi:hypothetical protein